MPRRKVTRTEIFDVDNNGPEPILDGQPEERRLQSEESEGLDQYVSQFGSQPLQIKVYKVSSNGLYYCFKGGKEIDEEKIKPFGAGEYELHIYVEGIKRDTCHIKIAEQPNSTPGPLGTISSLPQVQQAPAVLTSADVEIRMLREQNVFMREMALNGAGTPGAPRQPVSELVEAVKALKELSGGGSSGNIDLLIKGIELAKDMNGGSGDWKTAVVDACKEIGKVIAPAILEKSMIPANGNGNGRTAMQPVSQEQMLKDGIQYLKQKALSGMPPELVVDWIVNNAMDAQYQPFIALVMRSEFQAFVDIDADLAVEPYANWFRILHSGIRDAFNESENNRIDDSSGPARNIRDVAGHVDTRKTGSK